MASWRPTKRAADATRFLTFDDASAFGAKHVKGWPAWRVIGHTDEFYIELKPEGPWLAIGDERS